MAAAADNQQDSAVVCDWPLLPQPPNEALLPFFEQMVHYDLPDLAGCAQPLGPQLQPVIQAIDGLTVEQHQQCLETQA